LPQQDWTPQQLSELADVEELVLVLDSPDRPVLRVPVWPIVVGSDAYVRSYRGGTSGWYRRVLVNRDQAVALSAGDRAVHFESVDPAADVNAALDAEFLRKYATDDYRTAMVTPLALDATLRILPR
jgi:hypothetical protein